jgi:hypothetical protein
MKNLKPQFTIVDIQLGVGDFEFNKAFVLYQKGAVNNIKEDFLGYKAIVSGTHDYEVSVSLSSYDRGGCNCYIGQKDELCKHMLALAIALVYKYRPDDIEKIEDPLDQAVCSGETRDITAEESENFKLEIKNALSLIKSYNGPSSKWFQYQDSLIKGSRLILFAISKIPVCEDSAMLCIDTLKKLDKKLLKGVDDSDGTVSGMMFEIVEVLNMYVDSDNKLKDFIKKKLPKGESHNWEAGFGLGSPGVPEDDKGECITTD